MAEANLEEYGLIPVKQTKPDLKSFGLIPIGQNNESEDSNLGNVAKSLSLIPEPAMKVGQMFKGPVSQIAQDAWGMAKEAPSAVMRGITNIPKDIEYLRKNIPEAASQIYHQPTRAAKNAAAGGLELGGEISRIPPGIAKYLAHIGAIKPETAAKMPQPFSSQEVSKFGDELVGGNQQPGDELIRGAVRNAPSLYGVGKVAEALNPMQLTAGGITKRVLNARKNAKQEYSGESGHYKTLFNDARKEGLGNFDNLAKEESDISRLKKHTPSRMMESIEKFYENPSHEAGQTAIKDLGFIIRPLENRGSLPSWQTKQLEAAQRTKRNIQKTMFSDKKGDINQEFSGRHNLIQTGYATDVVPYTTNAAINAYRKGDLKKAELIDKLSTGKFAARKGSAHPQIAIRKAGKDLIGNKLGYGAIGALMTKLLSGGS